MIKNMAGSSFIIIVIIFIFSVLTFSGLHAVTATQEENNIIQYIGGPMTTEQQILP